MGLYLIKNKVTKKLIWNAFDWVKSNDAFCDFRQKGMILAFDVKKELIDDMFAKKLFYLCYENNVFVRPINNTIYFMPPYIINENQINFYQNLIEQGEGFFEGTKHILKNRNDFPGVIGAISDLFENIDDYEQAFVSYLGDRIKFLVVKNRKSVSDILKIA